MSSRWGPGGCRFTTRDRFLIVGNDAAGVVSPGFLWDGSDWTEATDDELTELVVADAVVHGSCRLSWSANPPRLKSLPLVTEDGSSFEESATVRQQ